MIFFVFFFQAEDGIRDLTVTGVQTCALPISIVQSSVRRLLAYSAIAHAGYMLLGILTHNGQGLSSLVYYVVTYALTAVGALDRKSTRLNSSHSQISYAVFCLKKKQCISCVHCNCAGHFNTGRSTADDDKIHCRPARRFICAFFCIFECQQNPAAQLNRVLKTL